MKAQAQQITYTILRLAPYIRRPELRSRLEEVALNCFVAAGLGKAMEVERHAEALLGLVQLGKSLYEVELINGDMLIGALKDLIVIARMPEVKKAAEDKPDVAELLNEGARLFSIKKSSLDDPDSATLAEANLSIALMDPPQVGKDVLPNDSPRFGNRVEAGRQWIGNDSEKIAERSAMDRQPTTTRLDSAIESKRVGNGSAISELPNDRQLPIESSDADQEILEEESIGGMVSIGSAIRQSAIIDKIRSMMVRGPMGELAGCRMKDLIAVFPDVSERTLRNDIQRLVNQNKIKRHGAGGFSVYRLTVQ